MDAKTMLALSKWDRSDVVRADVAPGTYEIDALIRIRGEMVVGKDIPDAKIAAAVPWQKICTVLLGKLNGVTIESVVREVLAAGKEGGDALEEAAKEVEAKTAAAIEALVESKRGLRRGAVKVVLPVIEEVEVNPVGRIVGAR